MKKKRAGRILITGGSGFIGTNLIESLRKDGAEVVNIDIKAPQLPEHSDYWRECDILHREKLIELFREIDPTEVVHLAARTDTDGTTVDEYTANTDGTANVVEAIKATEGISRVVFTSTQYVCGPGEPPKNDDDYRPHTVYGESKVVGEKHVKNADLTCTWTIIRPTNIWGRWHPRYPYEFWKVLKRGLYLHPGGEPVIRCYGYVGNIVFQIRSILDAGKNVVDRKVLNVGDRPISLIDWANAFSLALNNKKVRVVPRFVLVGIALGGELVSASGAKAPLTMSRYKSMTENYVVTMEPIFDLFGDPPYTLQAGVDETVEWLRSTGDFWV